MKKIILITAILLLHLNLFSQEVNIRRVQNSMIIDFNTGDTLSAHSSDVEAMQQLLNYKKEGRVVKMIGSVYEVDVYEVTKPEPNWNEMIVIDTVEITGFNYGNIRSKNRAVINYGPNIMIASKDSSITVPKYVFTARLERSKHWPTATTSYILTDIPFQFYESDSIYNGSSPTEMKSRTFGSAPHCIRHFINGIEQKGSAEFESVSCGPGPSTYAGGSFRHSNTFYNLDRSIDNLIRVEALNPEDGNIIGSREFIIPKK